MLYYNDLETVKLNKETVITLGKFDGIHKGHQKLIREVHEMSKINGYDTCLFTFDISPFAKITNTSPMCIFDKSEKRAIVSRYGLDMMIECPFTDEIRNMDPLEFVKSILIDKLKCKALVVGEDFCFGKDRKGTAAFLKEIGKTLGLNVSVMHDYLYGNQKISSTLVREHLIKGEMEKVNELLGFTFFAEGLIVHGEQNGRKMGFPTANIVPADTKILPPNGVYDTKIVIDDVVYKSITNIGVRPTLNGKKISIETNIPGFSGNIYDKNAKVYFYRFVRPERMFKSLDELSNQISEDVKNLGF